MVLDSKLKTLYEHFTIKQPDDWKHVFPASILALHGIGESTLNLLRLHLANRGLTLRGDQTPAYWQQHLDGLKRGVTQISQSDESIACPFRIVVDTREQLPYTFSGIRADAHEGGRPLIVETIPGHIGDGMGDYMIDGLWHECHVERKSLHDAQSTILGWGDHRERFEKTLAFLAEIPSAAVVIECTFGELIRSAPSRGKKSKAENAKILNRQVLAWTDDFRVPWHFCDNRRHAEISTFNIFRRYWRHHQQSQKQTRAQAVDQSEIDSVLL